MTPEEEEAFTRLQEAYDALQVDYKALLVKYQTQNSYVSALELTVDMERKKVNTPDRNVPSPKQKVSEPTPSKEKLEKQILCEQKEHYKKMQQLQGTKRREIEQTREVGLQGDSLKRMKILNEILATEIDYTTTLKVLTDCKRALEGVLSKQGAQMAFANIEVLYSIHQSFVNELDAMFKVETNCFNLSVGNSFIALSEQLEPYSIYINNQEQQCESLKSFESKKNVLVALFNEIQCFESESLLLVQLNSFIITPIQRICKYPLLLKELIDATEDGHEDKENLHLAKEKLKIATMLVNEKKKKAEHDKRLQLIIDTLDGVPSEVQLKNELFVCEGEFMKISNGNGRLQERKFYLFERFIIYGTRGVFQSTRIQMKGFLLLSTLSIHDVIDSDSVKYAFELRQHLKNKKPSTIMIMTKGPSEKNYWMQQISLRLSEKKKFFKPLPVPPVPSRPPPRPPITRGATVGYLEELNVLVDARARRNSRPCMD